MNKAQFLSLFSNYSTSSKNNSNFEFEDVVLMSAEASENTLLVIDSRNMKSSRMNDLLTHVNCAAVITSCHEEVLINKNLNYIMIEPSKWDDFQEHFCNELFPVKKNLKILGVTGTNGKTSTVEFIRQVCDQLKINCMTIGTLGVNVNNQWVEDGGLTTPPLITIRKIIHRYQNEVDVLALEVSSHALEQKRLAGLELDAGAWTNFSQDHLDYHETMEKYFLAKSKILNIIKEKSSLYVVDEKLRNKLSHNKASYLKTQSFASSNLLSIDYNRENLTLALKLLSDISVDISQVDTCQLVAPPGRFQSTEIAGRLLVVDFAHTPHALESLCLNIKKSYPERKLHLIFGCGGDRDKAKRPLMGSISEKFADNLYVTSDNPRSEDPKQIIEDIIKGITNQSNTYFDISRESAIVQALKKAKFGDIIVVAGKGHEKFQLIGNNKIDFNDFEILTSNARKIYDIA